VRVAIVGGGLAGLCAYATLRHGGLAPDEIVVFGDRADPTEAWAERARAIRQRRMRSESDGHVAATSFPGLAVRTARRRVSLAPLALSVCNRYRPSVSEFLEHAAEVRERSGWDSSFVDRRVERVDAVDGGFQIDDRELFAHVLLALGHPGLALPPELEGERVVRTSRMSTPTKWRSSAPGWPPRRSG
jgi:cation diffusion facilitator CzcD-associated flavoprotein CzcO